MIATEATPDPRMVPHYQVRCPVCGGLRRESEFGRESDPIGQADLLGQVFQGRAKIVTVDRLSYRDELPEIEAIRRRWLRRIRKALDALEALTSGVSLRFRGLLPHRTVGLPPSSPAASPLLTLHYGGLHARK